MHRSKAIELEFLLIPRLKGKLELLQSQEERESIIIDTLEELLREDVKGAYISELPAKEHTLQFVRNFLSYGVIEEMLSDINVEKNLSQPRKKQHYIYS